MVELTEGLRKATFEYLGVSDSSKVRHIERLIDFFSGFPEIIVLETSKMANPIYVVSYLATNREPQKKRELKNRFIIGFLFWTGVRVGEMIATTRKDLDLITRTYNVPTLKQRKRVYRPIPLNHVPVAELKLWNDYLTTFAGLGDRLVGITDRQVERIVKKVLGSKFTPHTLRHGLALWLYEYTKDIRVVSQILRHTNIANTLIYTRLSLEGVREKIAL